MIQFKNGKGSIVLCKMPEKRSDFKLEVVYTCETLCSNFTQFAVTSLVADDGCAHIALFTTDPDSP
jgi:hypothetical protein